MSIMSSMINAFYALKVARYSAIQLNLQPKQDTADCYAIGYNSHANSWGAI